VTRINYVTADCRVEAILKRLSQVEDVESYLSEVLDATIMAAGADMGTLQRFDDDEDCLRIVASRGFPDHVLKYFEIVRRDSHTSCGAALKRRMRVVVDDVSTSYLYVGTPNSICCASRASLRYIPHRSYLILRAFEA